MQEENLIFISLFIILILSYLFVNREKLIALWTKYILLIVEYNRRLSVTPNIPRRLSLLETTHWQYRGEGNGYLAISLSEIRKILRLRKSTRPSGFVATLKYWYHQHISRNFKKETKAVNFEKLNLEYYKVLSILIGECFVQPSEDVLLVPYEINKINNIIAPSRPEYRKKKHLSNACGSLLTDYAYLPIEWENSTFFGTTFAVEIKPKQGWIPPCERIFPLCIYCLNQYIKLQKGAIKSISEYCPMDLFSGNASRMKHAIKCLLKNPQNNLKIFQDGVLVHGENNDQNLNNILENMFLAATITESTNLFCDLIIKALLKPLHEKRNHECTITKDHRINHIIEHSNGSVNQKSKKECDLNREGLNSGCVLERILTIQELDVWGPEKVFSYWESQSLFYRKNKYSHVSSLVAHTMNMVNHFCTKCFFAANTNPEKYADQVVQKYLMSAIAKDCSLMITFRKFDNLKFYNIPNENIINMNSDNYAFKIGVFDLYSKPSSSILKHVQQRKKFHSIYKQISNSVETVY